jgi:putative ABC transport system permease protein
LSLSILERRRELGLLRIMGMTDRRVRRMVLLESALIAALGTIAGIALGLMLGYGVIASIDRLTDAGISLGFPWAALLLVLVLGVALGVIASLIPSRRSTRLEVLDAIAAT